MSIKKWRKENADKVKKYKREWYYRNREYVCRKKALRKKEIKEWLNGLKEELECIRCGEDFVMCIEFHHTDPNKKELSIHDAVNRGWGKQRILGEIQKCVPLCANCHRKEHYL